MEKRYIIGIDQSTQGTKALLFDGEGHLLRRTDLPHRQIVNEKGWVSHDLNEIYRNTVQTVKTLVAESGVAPEEIAGIGISNQRETTAIWDKATGEPLEEAILMERIRDRANAERYDRMIQKREEEIAAAKKQIEELQNISAVLRDRQTKLKRDISMIDDILAEGAMTEAHLRMLVEKIYVQETDGKLSLDIQIKAPFRTHLDVYENGTLTERYGALDFDWDRLARLLYGDGLAG